ncbi:MAG: hypothetical protein NZ703_03240, partial [Gemmataceae bacterium]|nr:hypothetical protein [Gemmataceae bacterium]
AGRGPRVPQPGARVGTPAYMSPEQLRGLKGVGPSSDVYSVGAVVYELFVGEPPHRADNLADLIVQVLTRPVDVKRAGLPEELRGFVGRCLRREAGERYADGQAALEAFRGVLRRAEWRRKGRRALVWLLVIGLLLGGGVVYMGWYGRGGREVLTLSGHTAWVNSVAYSPDGRRIVTGSGDNTAKVWELRR